MLGHRRCVCFTGANAIEGLGTDDLEAGLLDVCWVVTGVGGKQAFIIIIYIYTCYICIYHMYIYNTCIYIAARIYITQKTILQVGKNYGWPKGILSDTRGLN